MAVLFFTVSCDSPFHWYVLHFIHSYSVGKRKNFDIWDVVLRNMDAPSFGEGMATKNNRLNETGALIDVPKENFDNEGDWNKLYIWRNIPSPNFYCCWSKFLVLQHPQKKHASPCEFSRDAVREKAPTLNSRVPLIFLKPWASYPFPGRICRRVARVEVRLVVTSHRPIPILPGLSLPILMLWKLQRPTQMSNPQIRNPEMFPLQDLGISSIRDFRG